MSNHLTPYPAYKDSGVTWLGEIPAHWEVKRLKHVCRFAYGDSLPQEAREQGNIPVFGSNGRVGEHVCANTLAPCLVIGRKGSFGKVTYSAKQVFAIDTTFFIDHRYSSANLRWLYYLLDQLRLDAVSRDSAVPGLDREEAYQHAAPLPPPAEQAAIVRYLDHVDQRIRRYIVAKRKLIALLNEQKQAIIHHAVTRGLDSNVRLKPSGVEWLGDVPEHWDIVALGMRYSVQLGKMLDAKRITGQYLVPYLRNIDVQWDRINTDNLPMMDIEPHEYARYTVKPGDMLVCEGGEVGRSAFWSGEISLCAFQKALHRVRPYRPDRDYPRFLYYVMHSASKLVVRQVKFE